MLTFSRSAALGLVAALAVSPVALAADKKAEGELRWAMNYCGKALKTLEKSKAGSGSPAALAGDLKKLQPDVAKYKEYLAKAVALDATVTGSEDVYDKKENLTWKQGAERCQALDGEVAALEKRLAEANDAKAAEKAEAARAADEQRAQEKAAFEAKEAVRADAMAKERAEWEKNEAKRVAMGEVDGAVRDECAIFRKWKSSGSFDQRLARYAQHKKAALAALPGLADEKYTAPLLDESGGEEKVTKTVGEWFAFCDKLMPEFAAKLRGAEKAAAAAEAAENARQKAINDKLRAEEKARFAALVAATGGDRKRILQGKGFLPHWPRGGDLKSAPVWKWEVNITHEAQRCETYQFSGDKLTRNSTSLGGCG